MTWDYNKARLKMEYLPDENVLRIGGPGAVSEPEIVSILKYNDKIDTIRIYQCDYIPIFQDDRVLNKKIMLDIEVYRLMEKRLPYWITNDNVIVVKKNSEDNAKDVRTEKDKEIIREELLRMQEERKNPDKTVDNPSATKQEEKKAEPVVEKKPEPVKEEPKQAEQVKKVEKPAPAQKTPESSKEQHSSGSILPVIGVALVTYLVLKFLGII